MKRKRKDEYLNGLRVPVFYNKRNGQMTVSIPKKKVKKRLKYVVLRW